MRERVIGTRLDEDNYEQFLALARSKGMTKSALAHMFILDGLAQFDRRNDALMDRVEALINLVSKSNVLAASAVVSAALPVGVGGTLDDAIREQMRTHIMEAVKLGHNISSTYDKGTFKPGATMFLPIELQSVNSPDQLKAGEYAVRCAVYASPDLSTRVLHYEYTRSGAADSEASDVLFIGEDGATRMCDFIRMPDRSWRDSFGARSDSLLALLPGEIADYRLVEERSLPLLILGDAHDR